jgi:steroid delta-isomerase-like uncharacterized protein
MALGGKMTREEMWAAYEAHARGEHPQDIEKSVETVHEDGRWEDMATGEIRRGKKDVRRHYEMMFRAFPGWKFTRHAVHVTDDHIISEVTIHAVHSGPYYDIPPTNREVNWRICVVFTFKDGKVIGEREYYDRASFLRQIGVNQLPAW